MVLVLGGSVLFEEFGHCIVDLRAHGVRCREFCVCIEIGSQYFFAEACEDLGMDQIGVVKSDFDFCRMYVDVIVMVGHLDEEEGDGKSVWFDGPAVSLSYSV